MARLYGARAPPEAETSACDRLAGARGEGRSAQLLVLGGGVVEQPRRGVRILLEQQAAPHDQAAGCVQRPAQLEPAPASLVDLLRGLIRILCACSSGPRRG